MRLHPRQSKKRNALRWRNLELATTRLAAQSNLILSFVSNNALRRLVWFEQHDSMSSAIEREKAIKRWNRAWKIQLVEKSNPYWRDLYDELQ